MNKKCIDQPLQKDINKFIITRYRLRVSVMYIMLGKNKEKNIQYNTSNSLLAIFIKQ